MAEDVTETDDLPQEPEIPTVQFMIVSVGERRYALPSRDVQEIVQGEKIHELPFVPPYIEGLINFRGIPCTVVNPLAMVEKSARAVADGVFLVIKRTDDHFCLHITTADTLIDVPETEAENKTIVWNDSEILTLNTDIIEETLQKDLEC